MLIGSWLKEDRKFISVLSGVFLVRALAVIGNLLLYIFLGNFFGATGVGVFAICESICIGSAIFSRYGMDNALMRYVGQEDSVKRSTINYIRHALKRCAQISTILTIFLFVLRKHISAWYDYSMLSDVLIGVLIAIPAFSLLFIISGFLKGLKKPALAACFTNGIIALLSVVILGVFYLLGLRNMSYVGWSIAISAWVLLIIGFILIIRIIKKASYEKSEDITSIKSFMLSSREFFIMSLSQLLREMGFVLLGGLFLNSTQIGLFRIAERVGLLVNFVLLVFNSILPPMFSHLYYEQNMEGLRNLFKKGVGLGFIITSPFLILCLFASEWCLSLFGFAFIEASLILKIIAAAQLVNVMTGSVGFLLNMTGDERLMRNISLCNGVLGIVILFLLVPILNVLGLAIALAFVIVFQNLIALFFANQKIKLFNF